jgi:hypothetical protein
MTSRQQIVRCLAPLLLLVPNEGNSQWQRNNQPAVGENGQLAVHAHTLFAYGTQAGFKLFRSADNGENWTDISGSAPVPFRHIISFGGYLYGLGDTAIYRSLPQSFGQTWAHMTTKTIVGNGSFLRFVADGDTLFAYSDRRSVFRSTDGVSWQEFFVLSLHEFALSSFAAQNGQYVAVGSVGGTLYSGNGGSTWITTSIESTVLVGVFPFESAFLGLGFGSGLFRLNTATASWFKSDSGLPTSASLPIPTSITRSADALFVAITFAATGQTHYYRSTDLGLSWGIISSPGMGLFNGAAPGQFIVANASHLFVYYFGGTETGVYRIPLNSITSIEHASEQTPTAFHVSQNYPNPFNPTTTISFSLPFRSRVVLRIFNSLGIEVDRVLNDELNPGHHQVTWDARNVPSGLYFYQLHAGGVTTVRRMVFVR